jgi:hypothetical protein
VLPRFVAAIKTATAAHKTGGPDTQSVTNLLSSAPLLLACDASCLDFWKASAASAEHLQVRATVGLLGGDRRGVGRWYVSVLGPPGGGMGFGVPLCQIR